MITITDGMSFADFWTALNTNFNAEKYNLTVNTLGVGSSIANINTNFTTIKNGRTAFIPNPVTLGIGSGKVFKNNLNSNFSDIHVPMRDFSGITKYTGNPTIAHGVYPWGTCKGISNPWIRIENKIGSTYHALIQTDSLSKFIHVTSTDLINWTVGAFAFESSAGEWDDHYMVTPSVIKVGNLWHCYYSAKGVDEIDRIGLATSPDFITWTKYGTSPIFTGDTGRNHGMGNVILIGNTYYMYYCSYLYSPFLIQIRYATSPDGINWTYGGIALDAVTGDWCYTYIDPFLIKNLQGNYEMTFCASALEVDAQNMGYAISDDGINWIKKQTTILEVGATGQFDAKQIGNSCILEKEDGSAYIYYTGVSAGAVTADGAMAMV
jgi:predicted GH43/DUF377 family glycosyl hydrolase